MSQTAKKRSPKLAEETRAHEGATDVTENLQDMNQLSASYALEAAGNEVHVNLLDLIDFLTDFQKG